MPEQNQIELESSIDSLPVIANFIEETLTRFHADAGIIYKVQLVVDEAATNVINYAYTEGPGPLKIILELAGDDLIITIEDQGKPFNPTTIPLPDLNADLEDRKIGGLGIHFMRTMMDSFGYSYDPRTGNRLTLKKKLVKTAAA
jgi:anti-sigma regulatory factor (Ser/Thr protein kinase)